ncbi:ribonuclease H-like domain-containing protein [Apodospora peruviana]|uniref:Ribonuclease H-like domain-containing protein n=1 Tax=Apodospora peruviana TaxID=516989 RepID=A0AAE0IAN9_9PEZI|nr:ribonuclease H-like domain-containing protein [Apodospora peruviana]
MDPSQDFKSLQETVQKALVATTRTANGLANEDLQFQRTANPTVGNQLEEKSERLLQLASGLLKSAGKATNQSILALDDADDVEIQWKGIVDVIDSLLEKADTCLDEYTGLIKRKHAPTGDSGPLIKRPKTTTERLEWSLKRANILKPQNSFEKKIDNFESGPWKPLLTKKPHAKVPLDESLGTFTEEEFNTTQYKHPYEQEILNMQYPKHVYEKREPELYLPVEKTTAVWVDTYEGVLEMLEELKQAKEIALDLEHHDYRSYTGLLSLMQISTREKDWIVDTLVPWRHKLEVLNEVFADPNITKVLHGAFMDIIWLQRDLGLYVVGLFDTHHASAILQYPGRSLAFLLKKFVDFDADKKYQLADWRIRPLPDEMLYYARSDTHYLLYIYDMVRNELIESSDRSKPEKDLIESVVQKSKGVSLQRYEHPYYDAETGYGSRGWYNPISKVATLYDSEQFSVYKAVHNWRDQLARREDESPFFFMTQQVLADIARVLPFDKKALWSLLDSNARGLKVYLDELFDVIQAAKAKGMNGPTMMEALRSSYGTGPNGASKEQTSKSVSESIPDIKELKSQCSQLWGDVPMSSVWEDSTKTDKYSEKILVVLPYQFPQDVQDTEPVLQEAPKPATPSNEKAELERAGFGNQEFTLQAGRKRKLEKANQQAEPEAEAGSHDSDSDLEMPVAPSAEEATTENQEDSSDVEAGQQEKVRVSDLEINAQKKAAKERRKAHKAAKKAAKAAARQEQQEQQQSVGAREDEEDQPFDYSKASSVLHVSKQDNRSGRSGNKAFDPYGKKSGDAPKAGRKTNHVKSGGRSATFKK